MIRLVLLTTGAVTTLAGLAGSMGTLDGVGSNARFHTPASVGMDAGGVIALVVSPRRGLGR